MINLTKNLKAISLVEIMIATVVFSIAAVGTFSTLSMLRRSSNVSERSLQAVYFGRQILEELRAKIDQANWGQGANPTWDLDLLRNLNCDNTFRPWPWPGGVPPVSPFFNQFGGQIQYTCQDVPPGVRKLSLTITWNEP